MKNTQLTNALVIIGVLLIIYFFISPTKACKRDNLAIDPFKPYGQWLREDFNGDMVILPTEDYIKEAYYKKKKEYENMIAQYCRSQNSW